jgi:tRNA pseudouridine38-40 synthase
MPRYFLEVSYKGTLFSGFQVQENANSIQQEVEKAFAVYFRSQVAMTGSSRTDAGVHARQNFLHFDFHGPIPLSALYHLNAILPDDITLKNLYWTGPESHCRFDARTREYHYYIYAKKDPFLRDRAYFYPYPLDLEMLQRAAALLQGNLDFYAFSKRNTQAKTSLCTLTKSCWLTWEGGLVYQVEANRFLRGMVRGLVGTMLLVGRGKLNLQELQAIIDSKDCEKADFTAPAHGLFLERVTYPPGLIQPST